MTKFEYFLFKIEDPGTENWVELLNKLGAEGWEIIMPWFEGFLLKKATPVIPPRVDHMGRLI